MKKITVLTLLIPFLALSQTFEEVETDFKDFSFSSMDVGDIDGNGQTDIVFSGAIDADNNGTPDTTLNEIYLNNNGNFELFQDFGEYSVHLGDIKFIDFNNNGKLDIISTGLSYLDIINYKQYRFKNTGNGFEMTDVTGGRAYGNIQVFDMNHDGLQDYASNGIQYVEGMGYLHAIDYYENIDGENFEAHPDWMPGTQMGSFLMVDLNNNGHLDMVSVGLDSEIEPSFTVYLNNGESLEVSQELTGLRDAWLAFADFNGDGYQDIVAVGNSGSGRYLAVYFNDTEGNFSDIQVISNEGLDTASVEVADFNNDGYYDFIIIGNDANNNSKTEIFTYDPDTHSFSKAENTGLYNIGGSGNIAVLDYDGDNLPDVVMTGFDWGASGNPQVTKLYRNASGEVNNKPSPPTTLELEQDGNVLNFSWSGAEDDKTPTPALQYELRVGTEPGGQDIAKYVVTTPFWFLELEEIPNPLYWSVKSIDAAGVYSDASEEQVLGTENITTSKIEIFPNPASDILYISSQKPIQNMQLHTITGTVIPADIRDNYIDVSHLASGMYILKIEIDHSVVTKKVIIK